MKITAIIVTYNRPDALEAILRSIVGQRIIPDEVIIADDGSGRETGDLVRHYKEIVPFILKHVWQEDDGFRAAAIRNRAIRESTGDYLIFSDGDLVFHPCFFYDFRKQLTPGTAFIGSRVFLTPGASAAIIQSEVTKVSFPFWSASIEANRFNAFRLPFMSGFFPVQPFNYRLRGGLLGVSKTDIESINGWNESFSGWGFEDTELVARLFNKGIILRKLKFGAITYHLWHPVAGRDQLTENLRLLQETVNNRLSWCDKGLVKDEIP